MGAVAAKAVLLVEDNPADIYLIRKAVEEWDPHIHLSIVPNGRDALAFLRQEGAYALEPAPALILLDLLMLTDFVVISVNLPLRKQPRDSAASWSDSGSH
jgi:CheY-like chemotaxis protein